MFLCNFCFYNPSVLLRNPPPFTQGRHWFVRTSRCGIQIIHQRSGLSLSTFNFHSAFCILHSAFCILHPASLSRYARGAICARSLTSKLADSLRLIIIQRSTFHFPLSTFNFHSAFCSLQGLNEICPFGQVKSLCDEIFAPQK